MCFIWSEIFIDFFFLTCYMDSDWVGHGMAWMVPDFHEWVHIVPLSSRSHVPPTVIKVTLMNSFSSPREWEREHLLSENVIDGSRASTSTTHYRLRQSRFTSNLIGKFYSFYFLLYYYASWLGAIDASLNGPKKEYCSYPRYISLLVFWWVSSILMFKIPHAIRQKKFLKRPKPKFMLWEIQQLL